MVNLYLSLIIITATTVGKIILSSVAGMILSRHFSDPQNTLKGLSYIATMVFLPCLLFSNLCVNVSWEELRKFYWAPLFSCLPMGLGFLSSLLLRLFLTGEYHAVAILASTFQNGLTFPLSVLLNLRGIEWFTGSSVVDAESYIFLYNVLCSLGLWLIGEPLIARAKAKDVESHEVTREEAELLTKQQHYTDVDHHNEASARENPRTSCPLEPPHQKSEVRGEDGEVPSPRRSTALLQRTATPQDQLRWYRPPQARDAPIVVTAGSPVAPPDGAMSLRDAKNVTSRGEHLKRLGSRAARSLQSPPVLSSLIAIAISLTPPLRWLAKSPLGEPLVGGMTLIGHGAIPLQLLVLGSSIAANRRKDDSAPPATAAQSTTPSPTTRSTLTGIADGTARDVSSSRSGDGANAFVRWVVSRVPPHVIFTWCTVITRLVIIPGICFLTLHLLLMTGIIPHEKPFLLTMLVATMSPSAMNSTLICAMHDYHSREYARMIFFMYLTTIFTSTIWLFLFMLYLRD